MVLGAPRQRLYPISHFQARGQRLDYKSLYKSVLCRIVISRAEWTIPCDRTTLNYIVRRQVEPAISTVTAMKQQPSTRTERVGAVAFASSWVALRCRRHSRFRPRPDGLWNNMPHADIVFGKQIELENGKILRHGYV